MPLLFDPLYASNVQYVVSKSILDLYEIHYWQLLFGRSVFPILKHRYEKEYYGVKASLFLLYVFAITYFIEWFYGQRQRRQQNMQIPNGQPENPQNNGVVDDNPDQPNDANQAPNDDPANAHNQ